MKEYASKIKFFCLLFPAALLGILFWVYPKWWILVIAVAAIFVCAGRIPQCRGRETLWVFVFGTATFLPVNLRPARWYASLIGVEEIAAARLFSEISAVLFLLCMELMAVCFVSCLIWKKQYRVTL